MLKSNYSLIFGGGGASKSELCSGLISVSSLIKRYIKRTIFNKSFFIENAFSKLCKVNAFTLAEVLITLGIIGIVASMTLPSIVSNYKHKEATSRLKKFNTTMAQVLILSENENGVVNTWDMSLKPEDFVRKYFGPYIKALRIDSADEDRNQGRIYFTDGSTASIKKGRCMDIDFDVNGDSKPNKRGYDRFVFLACDKTITEWCSNKGWCTYYKPAMDQSRTAKLNQCKIEPSYCSALLEYDNWEFKEDYPYKL